MPVAVLMTAIGSDTEFEMPEDMQMPGGGDMPKGGPGVVIPAASAAECRAIPEDNKSSGWSKC